MAPPVDEIWERIGGIARLAPSPHNTQPFRIRPRSEGLAELFLVADRLLPREDHGNLYQLSAFGVFAATLERAARHFGRILTVTPVAGVEPADLTLSSGQVLFGHATISDKCTAEAQDVLLDTRRTSRLPYHDRPVGPEAIEALKRVAETGGHRLLVDSDPGVVSRVLRLNAEAIIDNLQIDIEREEIRGWYRMGLTPEYGDGLWEHPLNQPAWEIRAAFGVPWLFSWPVLRTIAANHFLKTQKGTRHIGLLCGPFSTWPELVSAGRTLLELWVSMSTHGIYMHPYGSMLTNPHYAAMVARQFGVDDCWLIFRFGYSDPPPRSPRLKSIILYE
jgi:hypothetical protein